MRCSIIFLLLLNFNDILIAQIRRFGREVEEVNLDDEDVEFVVQQVMSFNYEYATLNIL